MGKLISPHKILVLIVSHLQIISHFHINTILFSPKLNISNTWLSLRFNRSSSMMCVQQRATFNRDEKPKFSTEGIFDGTHLFVLVQEGEGWTISFIFEKGLLKVWIEELLFNNSTHDHMVSFASYESLSRRVWNTSWMIPAKWIQWSQHMQFAPSRTCVWLL